MTVKYRADIEGLRSLAIVPVVLFHAVPDRLSGGYVGVDIFFVISGFLITSLLLERLEQQRYSIAAFYEARIRRIFPALFFMLALVSIAACWILPPGELYQYGKTLLATALFASNMAFYQLSGYFEGSADFKPLLHTWSLAVEEQFYIVFPLLLAFCYRHFRARLGAVLVVLFALSLALSIWATPRYPELSFYVAATRAFELLAGSILAVYRPRVNARWAKEALAALGAGAIVWAIFVYDQDTPFPGSAALLPCMGAVLIIATGGTETSPQGRSLVARLLGSAPLRWIGLISYSLYLWHWPLLVLFRHYFFGVLGHVYIAVALTLAVALSIVSYRFVEAPFRRRSGHRRAVFIGAAAVSFTAVAIGVVMWRTDGLPDRFDAEAQAWFKHGSDSSPYRDACHSQTQSEVAYADNCVFGAAGKHPSIAVWADSYGAELAPALGEAVLADGKSVVQITSSSCPPAHGFDPPFKPQCVAHNEATLAALLADPRIETVVLIARYRIYLESDLEEFAAGLENSVATLVRAHKRVLIVEPVPDFRYSVPLALGMLSARGESPESLQMSRPRYLISNAASFELLNRLAGKYPVALVHTADAVCQVDECPAVADGSVLYYDRHHLSMSGASRLSAMVRSMVVQR